MAFLEAAGRKGLYIYSTCQIYKDMLIYIENTNVVDDTSHITPLLLYIYIYSSWCKYKYQYHVHGNIVSTHGSHAMDK